MKINGESIVGPNRVIVPIPRAGGKDIIFIVEGIPDMEPFHKLCPPPEPPRVILPGGKHKFDTEDRFYKVEMDNWAKLRTQWMAITSLRATPGLTWDTVDYSKPETWANYEKELKEAKFADNEIGRLIQAIMEANGLSEARVEEARQRFLMLESTPQNEQNSQAEEANSTPSGEPANGQVSSQQKSEEQKSGTTSLPGNNP